MTVTIINRLYSKHNFKNITYFIMHNGNKATWLFRLTHHGSICSNFFTATFLHFFYTRIKEGKYLAVTTCLQMSWRTRNT